MAKNYFRRYIWLIELINRKGYISFREISDAWSRSPLPDFDSQKHPPLQPFEYSPVI